MKAKSKALRIIILGCIWMASLAIATFGPKFIWEPNKMLTIIVILLNLTIGCWWILSIVKYLRELDELMKRIHLESMAISLGITVIGGFGYLLLEIGNIIDSAEIPGVILITCMTYIISIGINLLRYK